MREGGVISYDAVIAFATISILLGTHEPGIPRFAEGGTKWAAELGPSRIGK